MAEVRGGSSFLGFYYRVTVLPCGLQSLINEKYLQFTAVYRGEIAPIFSGG